MTMSNIAAQTWKLFLDNDSFKDVILHPDFDNAFQSHPAYEVGMWDLSSMVSILVVVSYYRWAVDVHGNLYCGATDGLPSIEYVDDAWRDIVQ